MNNNLKPSNKRRGATVALVVCFVAAIAIVGVYTVRQYRANVAEKLALAEEENRAKEESIMQEDAAPTNDNNLIIEEPAKTDDSQAQEDAEAEKESEETTGKSAEVNFSATDKLLWPVKGDVLLNYSMDKTVYFATLDQYKYNPALIIAGAENDQVLSAGKGIVKSIDVTAQTGTSITVDMGNGYEAVYGQLKEVPVKVGDYVEAKSVLGYLSAPTKYYSVEGCNLYFEVREDGQPVNPMEFLE